MSGSVVSGTLQLQIALGTEFRAERHPEVVRRLFRFTAHQAGHLWLGQRFHPKSSEDVWLQESAVDALGLRALRQLQLLDDEQAQVRMSVSLSRCIAETQGELPSGEDVHDTDNCGAALALFSEASIRQKQPGLDLFDLWKAVFARATEGRYTSDMYFSALGELAGADAERKARAIGSPGTRSAELILQSLADAGVAVERGVTELPSAYHRYLGRLAVRHVHQQACAPGAPGSASSVAPSCERIREPADVIQIAGLPPRQGKDAWEAVARLCAERADVPMMVPESATQPFKLPCLAPLPPMPEYLQVRYTLPVRDQSAPQESPTR